MRNIDKSDVRPSDAVATPSCGDSTNRIFLPQSLVNNIAGKIENPVRADPQLSGLI